MPSGLPLALHHNFSTIRTRHKPSAAIPTPHSSLTMTKIQRWFHFAFIRIKPTLIAIFILSISYIFTPFITATFGSAEYFPLRQYELDRSLNHTLALKMNCAKMLDMTRYLERRRICRLYGSLCRSCDGNRMLLMIWGRRLGNMPRWQGRQKRSCKEYRKRLMINDLGKEIEKHAARAESTKACLKSEEESLMKPQKQPSGSLSQFL